MDGDNVRGHYLINLEEICFCLVAEDRYEWPLDMRRTNNPLEIRGEIVKMIVWSSV